MLFRSRLAVGQPAMAPLLSEELAQRRVVAQPPRFEPAQPGVANPLAGHPYVLLRDTYASALARAGITVPAGMSPYKYVGTACASRTPDCQKSIEAIKAAAASSVRADSNGNGTFPGVAPGSYHLMISTRYNNQALMWDQAVQLKAGPNSVTLDQRNATPIQ